MDKLFILYYDLAIGLCAMGFLFYGLYVANYNIIHTSMLAILWIKIDRIEDKFKL